MTTIRIPIDIHLGVRRQGSGFDPSNTKVGKEIEKRLLAAVGRFGSKAIIARAADFPDALATAVQKDLAQFARLCIRFFFSQRASTAGLAKDGDNVGSPRVIYLDETLTGNLPLESKFVSSAPPAPMQLIWPGLRSATLRKKRRMGGPGVSTYFIYTDELALLMETAFGEMLADMFNPTITIKTKQNQKDIDRGVFRRGDSIVSIRLRLFTNQADGFALRGALASGDWSDASGDDARLMTKYLGQQSAYKLSGRERSRSPAQRPWVGPAIAFWVLRRAPAIIDDTVRKVVRPEKKAKRYKGADMG